MKLKTPKFRIPNILSKQLKVAIVILLCFSSTFVQSQTMTYMDFGTYLFQTPFPDSDLHFYLYGDGYHSFEKSNLNQYGKYAVPAQAKLYHAKPYVDELDEFILGTATEGEFTSAAVNIEFQNQVEVKRSWNMVDGQQNYFILMFENSHNQSPISGCVEFHYNSSDIDIQELEVLDNYGNSWVSPKNIAPSDYPDFTDKFEWSFSHLALGEQRFIYIPAKCLLPTMSQINTRGVMKIGNCEGTIPYSGKNDGSDESIFDSQIFTLESIVSTDPHDPNGIVTNPECWGSTLNEAVEYTIFFQNDGVTLVNDVNIHVDIEGYFTSINLLSASDDCMLSWDNEHLHVFFEDIDLPGLYDPSTPTYDETIGWVKLSLCYGYATPDECTISDGFIKFDSEAPIPISNELCYSPDCISTFTALDCTYGDVLHGISYFDASGNKSVTSTSDSEISNLEIIPSITYNNLRIDNLEHDKLYDIKIIDATSKIVREIENFSLADNIINVEDLKTGTYFIIVNNNSRLETLRFVKL